MSAEVDIVDALDAEISLGHGIEAALTGIIRSELCVNLGDDV
jgi:hypothetical protein